MDMLLILDFGGGQSLSVARRIRGENVYCEILPYSADSQTIREKAPKGLLLVGGTQDAQADCAQEIYDMGLPMLCMGYGARIAVKHFGGELGGSVLENRPSHIEFGESPLFAGLSECDRMLDRADEWTLPEGFAPVASGAGFDAAFACEEKKIYGLQFYPEANDLDGLQILANFAQICGCEKQWTVQNLIEEQIEKIRAQVGEGHALIAISGGVDSTVCAVLMHNAIGRRMHCLHVDTGLMRKEESAHIAQVFGDMGMDLRTVDAGERFLNLLAGVTDAETKRRLVEEEFVRVFEEEADKMEADFLVQGTIYNDLLDSASLGGMLASGKMPGMHRFAGLVEPLRTMFKSEVRQLGTALGLPADMVHRQPFPGPGLAVRCIGEVTKEKLDILRDADMIFREEIKSAGLDKKIRQYFAVLTNMQSGAQTGAYTVALRAVHSVGSADAAVRLPYDLLEKCVQRITTEVRGVARVVYDISGNPPSAVEWE